MDFNQLKYFIQISKSGNISKAAQILNISQPPLSNSLKNLENDLGVKLIKRNTRSLELTECGEVLYKKGEFILELLEDTVTEIKDISNGANGIISIGTVSYGASELLPDILSDFSNDYPKVKFKMMDLNSLEIINLVKKNILDLGIIRTPFIRTDLEYYDLASSSYVLVGNDISILGGKDDIDIYELSRIPLILNTSTVTVLNACFKATNLNSNILYESNDIHTLISLANKGLGYCIIPKDSLFLLKGLDLSYIDINCEELKIGTAIILSENKYHSEATRNLLKYFKINNNILL
ncbi:MAG: LysR family transcriptional regulator [Clostridium sp.]